MEIIKEAIEELKIEKSEPIQLCRGSIFDLARLYLKENEYIVVDTKIEGKLQDIVEQTYLDHLEGLGLDPDTLSLESGKERFFTLFYWVADDFPNRKKLVKSGMKAWITKWEKIARQQFEKKRMKKRGPPRGNSRGNQKPYTKGSRPKSGSRQGSDHRPSSSPRQGSDQRPGSGPRQNSDRRPGSGPRRPNSRDNDYRKKTSNPRDSRGPPRSSNRDQDVEYDRDGNPIRKKYSSVSKDPKNKFF